jgi:hypothetical protein
MDSLTEKQIAALEAALKTAHENENRWMEISAEFSVEAERMEQWTSTARLQRFEIARIDSLLVGAAVPCGLAQRVQSGC